MQFEVQSTAIPEILLIKPNIFHDSRGLFFETYHQGRYHDAGIDEKFVQDNHSHSKKGVLRGLHYQLAHPQAKLIYISYGEIFDVAVDIRYGSPTFGKWVGEYLSDENNRQMYIPAGFAHGFYVTSKTAGVIYKCSDFYKHDDEYGICWNDPEIGIEWPLDGDPALLQKDAIYPELSEVVISELPKYE